MTPVSHAYSGGNVVFGTAPQGGAVLETPIGNIPVFNNVRDGLAAGHRFNCGVVYLPPSTAARDGVAKLIRVNPDLRKIFIITEKIAVTTPVRSAQSASRTEYDIFGANGLGVADSWNQVRIGGALGGDKPGDSLLRGSIATFSIRAGSEHHRAVPAWPAGAPPR